MSVSAEYNPNSREYYVDPVFDTYPRLEASLLEDFIIYKSTGKLPDYFGRDTLYDDPEDIQDAELRHIHLQLGDDVFKPTPTWVNLADSQSVQWERTSDTALVYAQNLHDEKSYTLIAVFTPPAHNKARNYSRMRILAGYARDFSEL